eukprot:g6467.t1
MAVPPEFYAGADGLPEGVIQITETSPPGLIKEFSDVIGNSFCGTKESRPEAVLSWVYDPNASGENPASPLSDEPSAARTKFFQYLGAFTTRAALRHGGCFALRNSEGKIVTATVTYPPNSKKLYHTGLCEMLRIVKTLGGAKNVPPEMQSGDTKKKMEILDKIMKKSHKAHAIGRHLYVNCFATAVGYQGQGNGKKLMTFLVESARRMEVPAYLECNGEKNERFYINNGYTLMQRYEIKYKDQIFKPDGLDGIAAMVLHEYISWEQIRLNSALF